MSGLGFSALLCCVIAGCAAMTPMAFDRKATSIDTASRSVVLMTLEISRTGESPFQPVPFVVRVQKLGTQAQGQAQQHDFKLDPNADTIKGDGGGTLYLVRMALAPGAYKLMVVDGFARASKIRALFEVPLLADLAVKPHSIEYVGHIAATMRPRQDDEFRAGPLLPLVDQATSGMSESTWDITFEDRARTDIPLFRRSFPAMASAAIVTEPLPPFDRGAAQRWWEAEQAPQGKIAR